MDGLGNGSDHCNSDEEDSCVNYLDVHMLCRLFNEFHSPAARSLCRVHFEFFPNSQANLGICIYASGRLSLT